MFLWPPSKAYLLRGMKKRMNQPVSGAGVSLPRGSFPAAALGGTSWRLLLACYLLFCKRVFREVLSHHQRLSFPEDFSEEIGGELDGPLWWGSMEGSSAGLWSPLGQKQGLLLTMTPVCQTHAALDLCRQLPNNLAVLIVPILQVRTTEGRRG